LRFARTYNDEMTNRDKDMGAEVDHLGGWRPRRKRMQAEDEELQAPEPTASAKRAKIVPVSSLLRSGLARLWR